ncbi:MAG: hypothetical protein GDA44_03630 [Prochloron sp. SP5CPC1]|nr:hypothetical protein [Candidatus Paraprochloron terpiosi SP5CPC1]
MGLITINLGDAFLKYTSPQCQHLCIAIAQISQRNYLFVTVTTKKKGSETTCILSPGADVPNFIIHESVVAYRFAFKINTKELTKLIKAGSLIPQSSCSATILERIQQGGLVSPRLKNKYKAALKAFLEHPK